MRSSTLATLRTVEEKLSIIHKDSTNTSQRRLEKWEVELRKHEVNFQELSRISQNAERWNALSEQAKIENEKKKFAIMQFVYESIIKRYGKPVQRQAEDQVEKPKTSWWRKALFGFLIVTDITLMSIGGFFGSIQLINLLAPNMTAMTTKLISAVATAIEGVMMYSVFKPFLQRGLGIEPEVPSDTLAAGYEKRFEIMERMNSLMVNNFHYTRQQSVHCYGAYARILKCFNQDVKATQLKKYEEPIAKKISRYGLSSLNIGLSIAGTYFGSVLLLTAISAALIGTPVGWGIIATIITAQLLTRFFIRQNSVYDLLNPKAAQHNAVAEKLQHFQDRSHGINQDLTTMQQLSQQRHLDQRSLLRTVPHKPTAPAECPTFFKPCRSVTERLSDECDQIHSSDVSRFRSREC